MIQLDEEPLWAWVEDVTGGAVVDVRRRFSGGSRHLWFVDVERGDQLLALVLRAESGGGAFAGTAISLGREATVYRALRGTPVPLPGLLALAPDASAMLLERLPGTSDLSGLGEAQLRSVLESFIEALGALHTVDVAGLDLPGFDRPTAPGSHAIADLELWEGLYRTHLTARDPMIDYALAWLRQHAPREVQRTVVVQGDTGPGNFVADGGVVTGLVDWELCHLGDPMDDIAWLDMRAGRTQQPFADPGERDRLYERATGLSVDPVAVRYYAVFVQLRCAITAALALDRGGGAVGLVTYAAPHARFRVQLGLALADAIGARLAPAEVPHAEDTVPTSLRDRCFDHVIGGLREVVTPGLAHAAERLRAREAILLLEHSWVLDRLGRDLDGADAIDRARTLGAATTDAQLCDLAEAAGRAGDAEVLGLLHRGAQRHLAPWATPTAGGWSVTEPIARPR